MIEDSTIPTELYRQIVANIGVKEPKTLLRLCLVSQAFCSEAQRILYKNVTHLKSPKTHTKFLQVITAHPHLASHVEAYACLDVMTFDSSKEDDFKTLISSALRLMVNLKDLEVRRVDDKPCGIILRDCTFSLERLWWSCKSDSAELAKFLPSQTELKELYVFWSPEDIIPFPATLLTKLGTLRGNQSTIEAFLPGRSITILSWQPNLSSAHMNAQLTKELSHLRVLAYGSPRPTLSSVMGHLKSLEILSLSDYYETDLGDIPRIPSPNLKRVMFTGRALEYRNMHGLIATILLETVRTLERVDYRFVDGFREKQQITFFRNSGASITPFDYPML